MAELLAEIEGTFASGSAEKQVEILRRVTDLFLAGVNDYSDAQVDLFDGVIFHLAERIETRARAELARRLAPVGNAPPATVRALAYDASLEVAGPILSQSRRLTDDDLLAIAKNNSQPRLLAISKRSTVSENVSDVLVSRGSRDVVLSVTRNEGARFSDRGYGTLVDRSIDDDVLAVCVGMRKDIPREHFHALVSRASQVVFEKLAASNPGAVSEVQRVLAGITGQETPSADGEEAGEAAAQTGRASKAADLAIYEFAASGKLAETVTALSVLCHTPGELVGKILSDRRAENDFTLLLAKAAGLSWQTAKQICILRRDGAGLSAPAIEAAQRSFERLQLETAQRVISFYNERHTAVANFQHLENRLREQDGGPHAPRFSGATAATDSR